MTYTKKHKTKQVYLRNSYTLAKRLTASDTLRNKSPLQRQPPPPFKNGRHFRDRIVSTATATATVATVAVALHPTCPPSPHARPKVAPWGFYAHADTQGTAANTDTNAPKLYPRNPTDPAQRRHWPPSAPPHNPISSTRNVLDGP